MSNGDNLAANIIVEPVDAVGVDETVTNPKASLDALLNLTEHLESCLNASILSQSFFGLQALGYGIGVVAQHEVAVFGRNADQLAVL